mgnify:CR=1 FL=1
MRLLQTDVSAAIAILKQLAAPSTYVSAPERQPRSDPRRNVARTALTYLARPNVASLGYALFLAINAAGVWGGVFPFLPLDFQTPEIIFWFFLIILQFNLIKSKSLTNIA